MMDMHNHFLSALPLHDQKALQPSLRRVDLTRDDHLAEHGQTIDRVYLPMNCVISAVAVMRDGRCVETRTIGCESGYGLLHALGSPVAFERVFTQISGQCWVLPLHVLTRAALDSPTLILALAQHAQATLIQSGQAVACNALHTAEQRLARWLLLTRERTGSDTLPLTQEHMATMLGVQRTTVTAIAQDLQVRGLVSYARGRIRIVNRPALVGVACECYEAIELAAERIMQHPVA
jgi:CRP-like cAMP-binding protein